MWIRLLALVGMLVVVGAMMNAELPTSQTGKVEERAGSPSVEDPYPPPTPRP